MIINQTSPGKKVLLSSGLKLKCPATRNCAPYEELGSVFTYPAINIYTFYLVFVRSRARYRSRRILHRNPAVNDVICACACMDMYMCHPDPIATCMGAGRPRTCSAGSHMTPNCKPCMA